tara:strand:+ start:127401 stop:128234 length:834 start_codon:yes stop_codon:yes gene_type:complete
MTAPTIQYADMTLTLSYDLDKLAMSFEGQEQDALEQVRHLYDQYRSSLSFACDVCDNSTHGATAGAFVLHATLVYEKDDNKEALRLDFIKAMAELLAENENTGIFSHEGADISLKMADHNQAEYDLYLTEARADQPVLSEVREVEMSFSGDACLHIDIDTTYAVEEVGEADAKKVIEDLLKAIALYAKESLNSVCYFKQTSSVDDNDGFIDVYFNLKKPPQGDYENIYAYIIKLNECVSELQENLNKISEAALATLYVAREHESIAAKIIFTETAAQ